MLRLVINLDRSPERWQMMKNSLENLGVTAERVSACEGKKLSQDEIKALVPPLDDIAKINCPREILPNEIGCFLSHKKCWQKLVDSEENWALILEDDIKFSSRANYYIKDTNWIPEGVDIVQLHLWGKSWETRINDKENITLKSGDELVHPIHPPALGTQAYFISKRAARDALQFSERLSCPVDNFLAGIYSRFSKLHPTYRLNPAVVTTTDLPSSIGTKEAIRLLPYSKKIKNHPLRRWIKLKHQIFYTFFTTKRTLHYK